VPDLRALHVPGDPLVLVNVWDPGTARAVEAAGFEAVATSSAAVARSIGSEDHEHMSAVEALDAARRVIEAVSVPVTVDFEGGYELAPEAIAERLLSIGASGCNLEDTDHRGAGPLRDAAEQAAMLAAVRAAAGDALVINARVDTFARAVPNALREGIERGKRYLDAGADCIYPILAADEHDIAALVGALGVINVNIGPGSPSLASLRQLGVARVSTASGLHRVLMTQAQDLIARIRGGDDTAFRV
jgi:2-methylisocitrate lyase-like PEP mutase family enzyme